MGSDNNSRVLKQLFCALNNLQTDQPVANLQLDFGVNDLMYILSPLPLDLSILKSDLRVNFKDFCDKMGGCDLGTKRDMLCS